MSNKNGFERKKMEFNIFHTLCPHNSLAYVCQDDHTRMAPVCHRRDRIPAGHSWGICDEAHCPYFGFRIDSRNAVIYDSQGREIGTADKIEITAVSEPEDYE